MGELTRRTPLRAQPRSKGSRAERAVIDAMHRWGWTSARRNFQSGGQGGGDVVAGPPATSWEVKHRERAAIYEWLAQCEHDASPTDIPIVAFRRNQSKWYCALPLEDLLELLKLREAA